MQRRREREGDCPPAVSEDDDEVRRRPRLEVSMALASCEAEANFRRDEELRVCDAHEATAGKQNVCLTREKATPMLDDRQQEWMRSPMERRPMVQTRHAHCEKLDADQAEHCSREKGTSASEWPRVRGSTERRTSKRRSAKGRNESTRDEKVHVDDDWKSTNPHAVTLHCLQALMRRKAVRRKDCRAGADATATADGEAEYASATNDERFVRERRAMKCSRAPSVRDCNEAAV